MNEAQVVTKLLYRYAKVKNLALKQIMTETLPPLPDLEIAGAICDDLNQTLIDKAVCITYEQRPDLFLRIAEKENADAPPGPELMNDFFMFVNSEISKEIHIPNTFAVLDIFRETRRRVRLMHGQPL